MKEKKNLKEERKQHTPPVNQGQMVKHICNWRREDKKRKYKGERMVQHKYLKRCFLNS